MSERRILIIAGPSGAGETTFARAFLPEEAHCPRFINADLIATGLSPFEPEAAAVRAARVILEEIDGCIARGESFAFETTLAGRAYLRRIVAWRDAGWHVTLFFLALPSAESRSTVSPRGSARAATSCQASSCAGASERADRISSGYTETRSTTGFFTTMQATCRCLWTGRTEHD